MARDFRVLEQWGHWLTHHYLGRSLLLEEQLVLRNLLAQHFGKHAVLLGVPQQRPLLEATALPCHSLISPILVPDAVTIESDFHELPILTGSVDLVILPHILELLDNPRQLLAEACRIIKPEGLIVISGFNPYGFWAAKKWFTSSKAVPWSNHFIPTNKIKNWLQLADFALEKQTSVLYRPPLRRESLYEKFKFMEKIGKSCFERLGAVYVIEARAKVIPLTPIKMKWKQSLGGLPMSSTVSGHIAR